jgi:hypothetical protein
MPVVWLGIEATYSAPDGKLYVVKSDKIFVVSAGTTEKVNSSFGAIDLKTNPQAIPSGLSGIKVAEEWFGIKL